MDVKKYVIVEGQPILFGAGLVHAEVVNDKLSIESAGFFVLYQTADGIKVICTGFSASLDGVSSRPEIDSVLISSYLGFLVNK